MKKSKFTESQIVAILKQAELGQKVHDICREHGISSATFYQWRSKYGGMAASDLKRLKELEAENARLKRMYADMALENQLKRDQPVIDALNDILNDSSKLCWGFWMCLRS